MITRTGTVVTTFLPLVIFAIITFVLVSIGLRQQGILSKLSYFGHGEYQHTDKQSVAEKLDDIRNNLQKVKITVEDLKNFALESARMKSQNPGDIKKLEQLFRGPLDDDKDLQKQIGVPKGYKKLTVHEYAWPKTTSSSLQAFKPPINKEEKKLLLDLIAKIHEVCFLNNISYFMYSGTVLGSFRHHDLVPWDDDIDIMFNISAKDSVFQVLGDLEPDYFVVKAGPRLKFFSKYSNITTPYSWRWPYIDINFYQENKTHIWDSASEFRNYIFRKDIVFPLHLRPLANLYLYAPYDSFAYIKAHFNTKTCQTYFYSHKHESTAGMRTASVNCAKFKKTVPFVEREKHAKGVKETLKLRDEVLQTVIVEEPTYAICTPYTLDLIN